MKGGNKGNFSLKHRIFNVIFLAGIIMSFSASAINLLLGLGTKVVLINIICGLITVGLYIVFRRSNNYDCLALIIACLLSFVFFPYLWLANGGTYGGIPYYMIVNAGIIAVLLTGRKRKIIFYLYALFAVILLFIEYKNPALIVGYDSQLVRYLDLSFSLLMSLLVIVKLIAVLIDSYVGELEKSEEYLAILEEKNKEIEAKNQMLEKSNAEFMEAKEKAEQLNKLLYEEKLKLQQLSITDYLTGVYNKRYITVCLEEEIESARSRGKRLTVAMVDIDDFKKINDTHGHLYGDYVLERMARTFRSNLRQTDIMGRYGGDEFLIIMPNTGKEEGYAMMERLRQKIADLEWQSELVVTISGGVLEVEDYDLADLLNMADELLYKAKHNNKNMIKV